MVLPIGECVLGYGHQILQEAVTGLEVCWKTLENEELHNACG
jgi:hypothetical protein